MLFLSVALTTASVLLESQSYIPLVVFLRVDCCEAIKLLLWLVFALGVSAYMEAFVGLSLRSYDNPPGKYKGELK